MSPFKSLAFAFCALVAFATGAAHAQGASSSPAAPAGVRDPGVPSAAVPPVTYSSAFRRYRPNGEVEVGAWRDLNDQVGRIGGWRVYGREASPAAAEPGKQVDSRPDGEAAAPPHRHHQR
jgi:hypothetical protein